MPATQTCGPNPKGEHTADYPTPRRPATAISIFTTLQDSVNDKVALKRLPVKFWYLMLVCGLFQKVLE